MRMFNDELRKRTTQLVSKKTLDQLEKEMYDTSLTDEEREVKISEFLIKLNDRTYANSVEPIKYGYSKRIGGRK
jgi:hypothetical protein